MHCILIKNVVKIQFASLCLSKPAACMKIVFLYSFSIPYMNCPRGRKYTLPVLYYFDKKLNERMKVIEEHLNRFSPLACS